MNYLRDSITPVDKQPVQLWLAPGRCSFILVLCICTYIWASYILYIDANISILLARLRNAMSIGGKSGCLAHCKPLRRSDEAGSGTLCRPRLALTCLKQALERLQAMWSSATSVLLQLLIQGMKNCRESGCWVAFAHSNTTHWWS